MHRPEQDLKDPADLLRCLDALCAAAAPIPDVALSPAERQALAPYQARAYAELVRAVAAAVRRRPDLLAGLGLAEDRQHQLDGRLDRAAVFRRLHRLLAGLAQAALDHALLEQGRAAREALEIVQQARALAALPRPPAHLRELADALLPAEQVLARRKARLRRSRPARRPPGAPA